MTNAIKIAQPTDDVAALIIRLQPGEILRVPHSRLTANGITMSVYMARKRTGNNYTVRTLPTLNVSDITRY